MTYPTVPTRSRKSGELTFVRFVAVNDSNKGTEIFSINKGTTNIQFVVNDASEFNVGDTMIAIGIDDANFGGYFIVNAVNAGTIETTTVWPTGVATPFTPPDNARLYPMAHFTTTGQATDTAGGSSGQSDTWSTVGVEDEEVSSGLTFDASMTVYVDDDVAVSHLLGYAANTTPYVIALDDEVDYHVHVLLETYSSRNKSTAVLLHSTLYENVKWDSWNTPQGAGSQNFGQWELSGSAKHKYVLKPRA